MDWRERLEAGGKTVRKWTIWKELLFGAALLGALALVLFLFLHSASPVAALFTETQTALPSGASVGTFVIHTDEHVYYGSLLYASGESADIVNDTLSHVETFDLPVPLPPGTPGVDPNATRKQACELRDDLCSTLRDNATRHLRDATTALTQGLPVQSSSGMQVHTPGERFMLVHLVRVAPAAGAPERSPDLSNLSALAGSINTTCRETLPGVACPLVSNRSVFAAIEQPWTRYENLTHPSGTTVLGPVAWRAEDVTTVLEGFPGASAAEEPASFAKRIVFLPTYGVVLIVGVALAGLFAFYGWMRLARCVTVRPIIVLVLLMMISLLFLMQAGYLGRAARALGWTSGAFVVALYAVFFGVLGLVYLYATPGRVSYVALPVAAIVAVGTILGVARLIEARLLSDADQLLEFLFGVLSETPSGLHAWVPIGLLIGVGVALVPSIAERVWVKARLESFVRRHMEHSTADPGERYPSALDVTMRRDPELREMLNVQIELLRAEMRRLRKENRGDGWDDRLREIAMWRRAHRAAARFLRDEPLPEGAPILTPKENCYFQLLVAYRATLSRARARLPGVE